MEQFNVIFHTPYDINARERTSFAAYITDNDELAEKMRGIDEILHRVSSNAVSISVLADDVESAVARAHKALNPWGSYEHVTVICGLSVVAEFRHRVSVSKALDRII